MTLRAAISGSTVFSSLAILVVVALLSAVPAHAQRTFVFSTYLTPEDCLTNTNVTYTFAWPMDICVGRGDGSYSKVYQNGEQVMVTNCPLEGGDCVCGSGGTYTLTPCAGSQRIYIVNGTNDDVLNSIRAALTAPTQYQVSLSTYADTCFPRNQTLERVEITRTGVCSVADKKREAAEYYYPYYYYSCNETFNYYIQCNQSDCTECDPVPQSLNAHQECANLAPSVPLSTVSCPNITPIPAPVAAPVVPVPVAPAPVSAPVSAPTSAPTSSGSAPTASGSSPTMSSPPVGSSAPSAGAAPVAVSTPKASAGVVSPLPVLSAIFVLFIALMM